MPECDSVGARPSKRGAMGFFRRQEERLAIRFLIWQYEKTGLPLPPPSELKRKAEGVVDDAHRIARERGGNILSIMKELISDLKK
jgi:hypothetical protein